MNAKYFSVHNRHLWFCSSRRSYIFSSLVNMLEVFYKNGIWFVRSGDPQFWNDPWSHLGILRQDFSAIQWNALENKHMKVLQVYTNADQVRADLTLLPSSVKQVLQQNGLSFCSLPSHLEMFKLWTILTHIRVELSSSC